MALGVIGALGTTRALASLVFGVRLVGLQDLPAQSVGGNAAVGRVPDGLAVADHERLRGFVPDAEFFGDPVGQLPLPDHVDRVDRGPVAGSMKLPWSSMLAPVIPWMKRS